MAGPDPALLARISSLEQQVRELRSRLAALESARGRPARAENPLDRDTVREKVSYDWQK
jgi:uncharacterized protein with von Willebrand factor type A (vWA) domain